MSLLYFFWCTPREITAGDPYGACDWLITREMAVSIVLNKACSSSISREGSFCETFLPSSWESDFVRAFRMSKRGKGHFSDVIYGTIVLSEYRTNIELIVVPPALLLLTNGRYFFLIEMTSTHRSVLRITGGKIKG